MSPSKLTVQQALKMSTEIGGGTFCGVAALDEGVAEILAGFPARLELHGLEELSVSGARALAKRQGTLHFPRIRSLAPEALARLSSHRGYLSLPGLNQISDVEAEILSHHVGPLNLSGVSWISDRAATALSKHEGSVDLSGLTTISDEGACRVSHHRGKLSLWGLRHLSDAAADALSRHVGPVLVFPLIHVSPEARNALKRHRASTCEAMGLPLGPQWESYKGTFQECTEEGLDDWNFIYYPETLEDPVMIRISWRDTTIRPVHLPAWFKSLLPTIGKSIEKIFWQSLEDYVAAPAYLMEATAEINPQEIWSLYLGICDAEAIYWEPHMELQDFPIKAHISCYGGNHFGSPDYLSVLPLNHSMHDATLPNLSYWLPTRDPLTTEPAPPSAS